MMDQPVVCRGFKSSWHCTGSDDASLPLLRRVLAGRGFTDDAGAAAFLGPKLSQLHDPALLPGLMRAVDRLLQAVDASEAIAIYGDYDVDGVSATAILYHTLHEVARHRGRPLDLRTYVPHRLEEGYGLNVHAIDTLAAAGARVIISVDCGVTAFEPARAAKRAGVDLIITDHHNLPDEDDGLPDAYCVVHPRLPGSAYPFGELCGAGVAFKIAWELARRCGGGRATPDARALLIDLLAMTSLGVIADVVPLVDENRVIARYGLGMIKHSKLEGLRALVEASGLGGEKVDAVDVGFKLAPRLNACGRMGHAREAVELFTTATGPRARELAEQLSRHNEERQRVQAKIVAQAVAEAERLAMRGDDCRAIVLKHREWHAGIVGIVCSKLVEKFHRPVLLLCETDGFCHGSGRSIEGFDLHAAIASCADLLTTFGGHAMAAGLKMPLERFDEFKERFTAAANLAIDPSDLTGRSRFDCGATTGELNLESLIALEGLAPFGRHNPPVRVYLRGVRAIGRPQLLGSTDRHLSVTIQENEPGAGRALRVVGWDWAKEIGSFGRDACFDCILEPKVSRWNGRATPEAELVDVRFTPS